MERKDNRMARMRKNIDDQIQAAKEQVEKAKVKLEALEQQLDELCMKKKEQEIGDLYDYLQERGLSIDEVKKIIQEEKEAMAS